MLHYKQIDSETLVNNQPKQKINQYLFECESLLSQAKKKLRPVGMVQNFYRDSDMLTYGGVSLGNEVAYWIQQSMNVSILA